jgi:hypothetical protein
MQLKLLHAEVSRDCFERGLQTAEVFVKGTGSGREAAIRAVANVGINVTMIVTLPRCHTMAAALPRKEESNLFFSEIWRASRLASASVGADMFRSKLS